MKQSSNQMTYFTGFFLLLRKCPVVHKRPDVIWDIFFFECELSHLSTCVQHVNSNDKKKRTTLLRKHLSAFLKRNARAYRLLPILIWSLNLTSICTEKKIVKRRCVNWSPPDFEESLGRLYFITSNKKYTVEIPTCILKHQDETLKISKHRKRMQQLLFKW